MTFFPLRLPAFRTKTRRMGKVLRVTPTAISYYTDRDREVRSLSLFFQEELLYVNLFGVARS